MNDYDSALKYLVPGALIVPYVFLPPPAQNVYIVLEVNRPRTFAYIVCARSGRKTWAAMKLFFREEVTLGSPQFMFILPQGV